MQAYDVIIIGAGHNGLVCAAYLLKAGYNVLVLEKRSIPGGAATTEEALPTEAPGFKFNLCAIDHEFIHLSSVVEELELEKYGLEYLYCDPTVFCPHPASPKNSLEEWFDSEFIKAPISRLASELGAPPSEKTIAIGAMMMSLRHHPGMARPRGGTGALVQALVNLIKKEGGEILCDHAVEKVLVDNNGRTEGVRVAGGEEYRAKTSVISNLDAKRLFVQMVDPADIDAADSDLRERVERRIVNNNETILKIDCALSEIPRFEGFDHKDKYWTGSVLIADSVNHVEEAHALPSMGKIPDANPSMYVDVPTVLDPSMASQGKHTLWIEFFAPYQIAGAEGTGLNGTGWTDELKNQVADRVIDKLADYTPNLKNSIIARRVESPAELGERLGAYKGNYYHIDMTLEQMVFFRPLPEIANYKTPIEGLYLTGAGTHPGGAISGMPGRNCARVFLNEQQPIQQNLQEAGEWLKSTFKSATNLS